MLKKRVVAVVVVRDGIVVQSIRFKKNLPVGRPEIAVEFLGHWGVDEIVLIDISASRRCNGPDMKMVERVAKKCFVPLTVGGGINHLTHVDQLIHGGADKVSLNHVLYETSGLVEEIGRVFGAQCVVVSIDAIKTANGYQVYDYLGACETSHFVKDYARLAAEWGAGEILLNSVDRDGLGVGFDTHLVSDVCEVVNIPVICVGGAGSPQHFVEVFKSTKVHAAAAANFFYFSEHSVTVTKSVLIQEGIPIRHDTHADYASAMLDPRGRLLKKSDAELENLLFERIEKEVI
jgi:imidazole glycerol-phosphate synthase subunit HisF